MAKTTGKSRKAQAQKRLREYRHLYAQAKKKGLVKGDKDARTLHPSSYMKTKLNKMSEYLTGDYVSLKIPDRKIFHEYRQTPTASVPYAANNRVLVKKDKDTIARVKRSVVRLVRPLEWGEFERVPVPFELKSIADLEKLFRDEKRLAVIDALKADMIDEDFFFTFFGRRSRRRFGDMQGLLDWFLAYQSVMEAEQEAPSILVDNFELFRAKGITRAPNRNQSASRGGGTRRYRRMNEFQREKRNEQKREYWERNPAKYEEHKTKMREQARARRETMSDAERKKRNKKQAEYQKGYRQRKKAEKEQNNGG